MIEIIQGILCLLGIGGIGYLLPRYVMILSPGLSPKIKDLNLWQGLVALFFIFIAQYFMF